MTDTRALTGGLLTLLSLSEILPVYLVDRLLYLSVTVTGDKYCIFGQLCVDVEISYDVLKICRGE